MANDNHDVKVRMAEAAEEAMSSHTVGLVSKTRPIVGTGTAIRWGDKSLILTAKHVVEPISPDDLRFTFRGPGTLERAYREELDAAEQRRVMSSQLIPIAAIKSDNVEDLAVIEVPPDLHEKQNVTFYTVTPVRITEGELGAFIGHPVALSREILPKQRAIFRSIQYGRFTHQGERLLKNFDPNHHFLLEYEPGEDLEPAGFSGAGLWVPIQPDSPIWHANLYLFGIILAYYSSSRLLTGLRLHVITDFLRKTYGDCSNPSSAPAPSG